MKLNENIINLHNCIIRLEMNGSWYLAEVMRGFLIELINDGDDL